MEDNAFRTPKLIPGAWYVTFTSDDQMRPVYVTAFNIEPDRTGVWRGTIRDSAQGEWEAVEGSKRFSFYARVKLPLVDRNNPEVVEMGEHYETSHRHRELLEKRKALEAEMAALNIARITAGGTR